MRSSQLSGFHPTVETVGFLAVVLFVKFDVLESPGNNAEAFGRSFVRSERYGSDTAFKRYYYDFTISDLEVGWENIPCHMFMMENGTIRLVAGDKFKRYFLTFEKI